MTNSELMHWRNRTQLHERRDEEANAQMDDLLDEARRNHPASPQVPLSLPAPEQALAPVVLVEGFFSFFNEVSASDCYNAEWSLGTDGRIY